MKKIYSEKEIEEAIKQSPGNYKRFGLSKSGNLKIFTDAGMYIFKSEKGKMILTSNSGVPFLLDDASCDRFISVLKEEIQNWNIEVVNVEPSFDGGYFQCVFRVQLLKEAKTFKLNTEKIKNNKRSKLKIEADRLIKQMLTEIVEAEKWIKAVFERTLIDEINQIHSTDHYSDHVRQFIQCIQNANASEITYEKKENVIKVRFGNVVTIMQQDMCVPIIKNRDAYENVVREIVLAKENPDIFKEANEMKKLFKKYGCKLENKITLRDIIRSNKDEFCCDLSVKDELFTYQKSILIGIDYDARRLTKSIDDIEKILKDWISEKRSQQRKEIDNWKKEGIADNILVDSMISILSKNDNITMNKLIPLLKGNKVQTLTPIEKTDGMGMFPKLPDEIIEQTVRKLKEKGFLFEKYHKGEYTTYYTLHFKEPYLKIIQDPDLKKTEDLIMWIRNENRNDGSYEWLEYLNYLNEQQDIAFEMWIPLMDILEKPVVCCYANTGIQNAIQKAPEEIKDYFKSATYERYAGYVKQALR